MPNSEQSVLNLTLDYSPNFTPNRARTEFLIIHHTGGKSADTAFGSAVDWLGRKEAMASAHFVIPRRMSNIVQMVRLEDKAWHAGRSSWVLDGKPVTGLNSYAIGIELAGNGNRWEYTDFQYAALAAICIDLIFPEYPHLADPERILGHEQISPGRKVDPGRMFDWRRFYKSLEEGGDIFAMDLKEESEEDDRADDGWPEWLGARPA